jgi:hypothetical protein
VGNSKRNNNEIVQMLFNRIEHINLNQQASYGRSTLMVASVLGHQEIAEML